MSVVPLASSAASCSVLMTTSCQPARTNQATFEKARLPSHMVQHVYLCCAQSEETRRPIYSSCKKVWSNAECPRNTPYVFTQSNGSHFVSDTRTPKATRRMLLVISRHRVRVFQPCYRSRYGNGPTYYENDSFNHCPFYTRLRWLWGQLYSVECYVT